MADERKCEWTLDEPDGFRYCPRVATHTTCDPIGGVVCEEHQCRCSRLIGEKSEHVVLPQWIARMIEECEEQIERGLDHSLHNAPGRVRIAHHALERLLKAIRRLALAEEDKDTLRAIAKQYEIQRVEIEALRLRVVAADEEKEKLLEFNGRLDTLAVASRASWSAARERLLHALHHISEHECPEEHDENEFCPRRAAKEAIDNRPCSTCKTAKHDA